MSHGITEKIFLVLSDAELMTLFHSRFFAKSTEQVTKQIGGVIVILRPERLGDIHG